jgi:hypothetical protein
MSYIIVQSLSPEHGEQSIIETLARVSDQLYLDTVIQLNHNLYSALYSPLVDVEERKFCQLIYSAMKTNPNLALIEIALPITNEILDRRYEELARLKRFIT